jgi:hypothetical protein
MAMPFPTLDWIFERRTKEPTPGILKAAIILQGIFVMGQTRPAGTITGGAQALMYFGLWAVEAAVFTALWKMKRWPVLILVAYALVHAVTAMPHYFATTPRSMPEALLVAAIILVFHNLAMIPAIVFWRRMTWK